MYDFSPEFGQCSHVQFGVFDGGVLCFIQNKAESFILRRNFVKTRTQFVGFLMMIPKMFLLGMKFYINKSFDN